MMTSDIRVGKQVQKGYCDDTKLFFDSYFSLECLLVSIIQSDDLWVKRYTFVLYPMVLLISILLSQTKKLSRSIDGVRSYTPYSDLTSPYRSIRSMVKYSFPSYFWI